MARRTVALLPWLGAAAFTAALALQKLRSYDYWWHLRTGRLIAETGSIPTVDSFSYSVPGAPWLDVHWLFQRALYAVYELGGHDGVVIAKAACALLVFALLMAAGRGGRCPAVAPATWSLAAVVIADRLMPRPELTSFVLLALYLWLLERDERTGDAWLWALAPVQAVWANTHGLQALGPALVGLWLAGCVADGLLGRGAAPGRSRRLALLLLLVSAASLATPHGLELVRYSFLQVRMISTVEQRETIGLRSLEIGSLIFGWRRVPAIVLGAFGALVLLSAGAMAASGRRLRLRYPLVWASFLVLALGAIRNTALFAIVAVPIVTRGWLAAREALPARLRAPRVATAGAALVGLVLLAGTWGATRGQLWHRLGFAREPGFGVLEVFHPVGATDWIAKHRPPGPIGHHMGDGGYLIWRLHPDYPVLADGRLEVYRRRPEVLELTDERSFRELDGRYRFGTVLVHWVHLEQDALLAALLGDAGWRLVFADEIAAVFARSERAGGLERFDAGAPGAFPSLPEEPRSLSALTRRVGRARLLRALGRGEEAHSLAARTRQLYRGW